MVARRKIDRLSPDARTVDDRLPLAGTPALAYLQASALDLERRIANVRIWVAVVAVVTGPYLALTSQLPLVLSPWLYSGMEFFLLFYAVVYRVWAPYRFVSLHVAARAVTLLDMLIVLIVVLNNGGLRSPYWGLGAVVLLLYIIRFDFTPLEMVISGVLLVVGIAANQWIAPLRLAALVNMCLGITLTMVTVAVIGVVITRRQNDAVRHAFESEARAVSRIVNAVQHEVNNPLAVAAGNMELLKLRRQIASGDGPYLERIEQSLARVSEAVARLRELQEDPAIVGEGPIERYAARSRAGVEGRHKRPPKGPSGG